MRTKPLESDAAEIERADLVLRLEDTATGDAGDPWLLVLKDAGGSMQYETITAAYLAETLKGRPGPTRIYVVKASEGW